MSLALSCMSWGCKRSCSTVNTFRPVSTSSSCSASRFHELMTSGFSQIAFAPTRSAEPNVRIVQVVGRTNARRGRAFVRAPPQFFEMAIESLDLGEKADVQRVAVEDADCVVWVDGRDQPVARRLYRLQVPGSYETSDTSNRKVLQSALLAAADSAT